LTREPPFPMEEGTLMQDAALPFRPRVASPADRALASISAQTLGVRRRSNRFVVQGALFTGGGALLLTFALLVGLAFLLSETSYALGSWALLFSLVVVLVVSLRNARRAWMPKSDAALRIDRRAELQDRLATLASAPVAARRSQLWDVLLHENLGLLPRWEPRRLQPRAMPRSGWFFLASFVVALLAARELPGRGPQGVVPSGAVGDDSTPPTESPEDETLPGDGASAPGWSLWSDLPEDLRQAILGSRATRNYPGNIPQKTQPLDRERGGPAIAGSRMASNGGPVRSAPAEPDAARFAGQGKAGKQPPAAPGTGRESLNPGQAGAPPIRGDALKTLDGIESGRPRNSASTSRAPAAKNTGSSGSGGAGAGSGADKDGLFGERQEPGKATGSFALNLEAMRSSDSSKEGEDDSPTALPANRLAEDQRLDDAVRRAQVPAEYETIVQRLFNRGTEPQP
jgi:hypothetical protein